jgi:hypothetical protein
VFADKKKTTLAILLLFLGGLVLRLLLLSYANYTADDSFITFRYAENISSGWGFVYNSGERVLGTTTPLYTLLLSLLIKSGLDTITLSKAINILADCLAGVLIFLLLRSFKFSFAFLASLFYLFFPRVLVWSISGMETGLYVFLIALSFYLYQRKALTLLPIFLALAWLTRFDGFILIAALFFDYLLKYRKLPLRMIAFTFLLILPWLIFATFYFGSPIPNSILAKKALYQDMLQTPKVTMLWEFFILKTKIGWLILALSISGIYRILRKTKELSFIILWTVFYLCFYFFAGTRMYVWYYVPFYLGYLILTAQGVIYVYERLSSFYTNLSQRRKLLLLFKGIQITLLIFVVVFSFLVYWKQMKRTFKLVRTEQIGLEQIHKKIGLWLRENSDEKDTVCAEDIGYMGYFSQRYILDQDGLVSPQAVPFNRKQNRLGLVQAYFPRYVVVGFYGPYYRKVINSDWFKNNYQLQKIFNILSIRSDEFRINFFELDFKLLPEYAIYRRIESFS